MTDVKNECKWLNIVENSFYSFRKKEGKKKK